MATKKSNSLIKAKSSKNTLNDKSEIRKNNDIIFNYSKEKLLTFLALVVLFFTFFYVYSSIFDKKIDLNGDNMYYFYLGKNLYENKTYAVFFDILQSPHGHFPPGYPLIIAFFMTFSKSVIFIKVINGIFLFSSSLLIFFMVRKIVGDMYIAFTSAFFLLYNSFLLNYSTIMMSEVPFIFFSTLSIFLLSSADYEKPSYKNTLFFLGIITIYFSFLIRSQGIAILGGIIFFYLLSKKWQYLFSSLAIFGLCTIPWIMYKKWNGITGSSYLQQLAMKNPYRPENGNLDIDGLFTRIASNAQRYIDKEIPSSIINNISVIYQGEGFVKWSYWGYGVIILIFAVIGIWKIQTKRNLIIGYIGGTLAILMLWPEVWNGTRFLLPIVPFIAFSCFYGIKSILDWVLEKVLKSNIRFNGLILIIIILSSNNEGIRQLKLKAKQKDYYETYQRYFDVSSWVKQNIKDKNEVIVCRKPELFHHFSSTYTSGFNKTLNQNELLKGLNDVKATHVVLDELGFADTGRYLYPVVQSNPDKFEVIYKTESGNTYLLKYKP